MIKGYTIVGKTTNKDLKTTLEAKDYWNYSRYDVFTTRAEAEKYKEMLVSKQFGNEYFVEEVELPNAHE